MNVLFVDVNRCIPSVGEQYSSRSGFEYRLTIPLEDCRFEQEGVRITGWDSDGMQVIRWHMATQNGVVLVDCDTGKVVFSSKGYSCSERNDPDCPFYKEFLDFVKGRGHDYSPWDDMDIL
jgi:hypothetical protein